MAALRDPGVIQLRKDIEALDFRQNDYVDVYEKFENTQRDPRCILSPGNARYRYIREAWQTLFCRPNREPKHKEM